MTTSVVWLRRDLRLADNPALLTGAQESDSDGVCVAVVLDQGLLSASDRRAERYLASLRALNADLDGALTVLAGPAHVAVPALAAQIGADTVHVTRETTPYGRRRDERVGEALAASGAGLRATGTPYAVGPGSVRTGGGTAYKVFTPFSRAWRDHGWARPAPRPPDRWLRAESTATLPDTGDTRLRRLRHGGRALRIPTLEGVPGGRPGRLRRRSRPARPGQHEPAVGGPEVWRDPPPHPARGPARA